MLTVGGIDSFEYHEGPCDTQRKGINVFDMSSVTWGSVYDAAVSPYTVPQLVVANIGRIVRLLSSCIGGTSSCQPSTSDNILPRPRGNVTAKSSSAGFSQPGLVVLFNPSASSPSKLPSPPQKQAR
jgi:hypothetical protein